MKAVLPTALHFRAADDLVRLGRDNDGGYLVSERDVLATDALIGLGINDDWSFERDFVCRNDVPVIAYDGSVGRQEFWNRAFAALPNPFRFRYWFRVQRSYARFFTGRHRHVERFVGASGSGRTTTMAGVLADAPNGRLFLKVDIEGWEYEILDDLLDTAYRTSGLVIEFHDCHVHLDEISTFVQAYPHPLVHVHANNFATVDPATQLPCVLEVTFSGSAPLLRGAELPHPLDMPNDATTEEIGLSFN